MNVSASLTGVRSTMSVGRALGVLVAVGSLLAALALLVSSLASPTLRQSRRSQPRRALAVELDAPSGAEWHPERNDELVRFAVLSRPNGSAPEELDLRITIDSGGQSVEEPVRLRRRMSAATVEGESAELVAWTPFELDLRGHLPCVVRLAEPSGQFAAALLIRASSRRASADDGGAPPRLPHGARSVRLAKLAGELDWSDLATAEHQLLVTGAYHRLIPSPAHEGVGDVRTLALLFAERSAVQATPEANPSTSGDSGDAGLLVTGERVRPGQTLALRPVAEPRVLRLDARTPITRDEGATVPMELDARLTSASGESVRFAIRSATARDARAEYVTSASGDVPSERTRRYLLVPGGASVTIASPERPADLRVAELDPAPEAEPTHPNPRPAAFVRLRADGEGKPSPPARVQWRVATSDAPSPLHKATFERAPAIPRPNGVPLFRSAKKSFVPASTRLAFDVREGAPPERLALSFRLPAPADVTVRIDAGSPRRRLQGIAERLTQPRRGHISPEGTLSIVLGDDLAPGAHTLDIELPAPSESWVRTRWQPRARPAPKVRWLSEKASP